MMKQVYKTDDLRISNDTPEEQERARKVFEELKKRATTNQPMTELEKNFFCRYIKNSLLNDGKLTDYPCCENFIFSELFRTYGADFTGGSVYTKIYNFRNTTSYGLEERIVPKEEVQLDLEKLDDFAKKWEIEVMNERQKDTLLQVVGIEFREERKTIDKSPEFDPKNDPFVRGKFRYRNKIKSLVLFSKYIYLMAKEVIESSSKDDLLFKLCGLDIELDESSIAHIVQGHYGEGIKKNSSTNSHFYGEFAPRELSKRLMEIISSIDKANILEKEDILNSTSSFHIPFLYKGVTYSIWIRKTQKGIKGRGMVKYNRLDSFYPVSIESKLKDIEDNFSLVKIDNHLSVYKRK